MFIIVFMKVVIIVYTVAYISQSAMYSQDVSNYLHLAYYVAIAAVECMSSVFLVRKFRATLRSPILHPFRISRLFRHLMRSTEIRVTTMVFIGVIRTIRAIINPFGLPQGGVLMLVILELDDFIYTIECLFPIVM